MKFLSTVALGLALAMGAAPAVAQKKPAQPAQPSFKFSKQVQPLLAQAQKLQQANDNAGALAVLQQAEAVPNRNADDNYMINVMKINAGIATKDNALLEQAIEGALASGRVPAEEQPKFIRNLGALALQRNDNAKALQQFERLVALNPNDTDVLVQIAELQRRNNNSAGAVATFQKAIDARKAANNPAPEAWYRRMLAIAYDSKLPAQTTAASEALVTSFPSPTNWRDSLIIFRDSQRLDEQANLDVMRLMRAAGALNGERDYVEYADTAALRGLPGEAKTVIDEGIAKNMLQASKPVVAELNRSVAPKIASDKASLPGLEKESATAKNGVTALGTGDAYYGYGNYAKAAAMYRLAMQKGGVDANTANLRLGMALAMSGDKAGAQQAFTAVKGGPREQLARFWNIWMGQRA